MNPTRKMAERGFLALLVAALVWVVLELMQ